MPETDCTLDLVLDGPSSRIFRVRLMAISFFIALGSTGSVVLL